MSSARIEVRRRVLPEEASNEATKEGRPIDQVMKLYRFGWLGHVFPIPSHRLPRCEMLADIGSVSKTASGGQTQTRNQFMNSLTVSLGHVRGVDCLLRALAMLRTTGFRQFVTWLKIVLNRTDAFSLCNLPYP